MTNKEAIEILTNIKNTTQITWTNGADVAFDLAINALERASQAENAIEIENTAENNRFCKTCKHYIPNEDDLSKRCYDCLLPNFENKEVRENKKLWKYPNWEAENE